MAASVDVSELTLWAADLERAAATIVERATPVMSRAGLNVKRQQAAEMAASPSFRGLARSITYDTHTDRLGVEVQVGPDHAKGGALANIAYFGAPSNGGGATVPDPLLAAEAEAPTLLEYLGRLLEDV